MAAGDPYLVDELDTAVTNRILALWTRLAQGHYPETRRSEVTELLTLRVGLSIRDFFSVLGSSGTNIDTKLTIVQAMHMALELRNADSAEVFDESVDAIFQQHGIRYRMKGGDIYPVDSLELFESVVEPILIGGGGFEGVNQAYGKALLEIKNNDPGDAITDACVALQELLKGMGYEGKVIGDQLRAAKRAGWLKGSDEPLIESIEKAFSWVSGQRNDGEAHRADPGTTLSDAWLMVHIVGALIVRLAEGDKRGE